VAWPSKRPQTLRRSTAAWTAWRTSRSRHRPLLALQPR